MVMGTRTCLCFPHFPLDGIESRGSAWICTRSWAGCLQLCPSFSYGEALAGEQSPRRRRLAIWVAFTAQTAVCCLLQGEGGNCTEFVLSAGSALWTAVGTVLPQVTVATEMSGYWAELKPKVRRGGTCNVRCQRAQEGTVFGSIKALHFCVGLGERGGNGTTLALQRQLLLDSGSLSHKWFLWSNSWILMASC